MMKNMEVRGPPNRREVEAKIANVGDYVKIEYLSRCLSQNIDFDTRKFVLSKLGTIYENKGMITDAAKLTAHHAELSTTFEGKMNDFLKSAELYVKAGEFDLSEVSFSKALACASGIQKERLKARRREYYKQQADVLMKKDKRKNAMEVYEKMLTLDYSIEDKKGFQKNLMALYEKLGKIREYYAIQKAIQTNVLIQQEEPSKKEKPVSRGPSADDFLRGM